MFLCCNRVCFTLQGCRVTVYFRINILVIVFNFFVLFGCWTWAEHKGIFSEECGKQSSSGAPLTSIVFFFLLWKSMVPQNSLVTNFLQNIFLCVQQNKEIHTGLELLEGV